MTPDTVEDAGSGGEGKRERVGQADPSVAGRFA